MKPLFRHQPPSFDFKEFYFEKLGDSIASSDALSLTLEEINKSIFEVVEEQGLPLVIKNLHFHPNWNTRMTGNESSIDLFSFEFLEHNYGDKEINLRDNNTGADHSGYTISSYFSYLKNSKSKNPKHNFYGKDLSCPLEWQQHLSNILPSYVVIKGPHDLLRYLPMEIQPECLMLYIGGHGTNTPFHVDICGSLGHNLLVARDNLKAHALWTIIPSAYRTDACKYWGGIEYFSSQNSATISPSKLGYLNAIELDSLLIVAEEEFKNAPFPVYRFIQNIGDLVIIPPDSPHQVQNFDGSTVKVAWNRITSASLNTYFFNIKRHYTKLCKQEVYRTRAICYHSVVSLTSFLEGLWLCQSSLDKVTASVPASIVSTIATLCGLLRIFKMLILDEHIDAIDTQGAPNPFLKGNSLKLSESVVIKYKDKYIAENYRKASLVKLYAQLVDLEEELPHTRICDICKSDILNRFFHCSECVVAIDRIGAGHEHGKDSKFKPRFDGIDICFECYARGRSCKHLIMTLMQTLENSNELETIFSRALRCIKSWACKTINGRIQGTLPSTTRDLNVISGFIETEISPVDDIKSNTTLGNLAFNLLLERAHFISPRFQNNTQCKMCSQRPTHSCFIKCFSCSSNICHCCIWNYYGMDPFESLKDGTFKCNICAPIKITSSELVSRKIKSVLPWIGCISLDALHGSSTEDSFVIPCFFDMVVFEATRKVAPASRSTDIVRKALSSFFEKCSETKSILELQHRTEKRKSLTEKEVDFETCLSTNLDLGFGVAVKNREFKKKKNVSACLRDQSLAGNNLRENIRDPRISAPAMGFIRCQSSSQINNEA